MNFLLVKRMLYYRGGAFSGLKLHASHDWDVSNCASQLLSYTSFTHDLYSATQLQVYKQMQATRERKRVSNEHSCVTHVCSLLHMQVWKVLIVLHVLVKCELRVHVLLIIKILLQQSGKSVSRRGAQCYIVMRRLAPTTNGGDQLVPSASHYSSCLQLQM